MLHRGLPVFLVLVAGLTGQSKPSSAPATIAVGSSASGTLGPGADSWDLSAWVRARQTELQTRGTAFTFTAPTDDSFTVTASSLEFDTGILLLDLQARTQRFVDDGGIGVDARVTFRANSGDRFVIVVCDPDGEYGAFTLSIELGGSRSVLGDELQRQRVARLREALEHCRTTLAADDPRIASRLCDLARVLPFSGSFEEPDKLYAEAVRARSTRYGENSMIVALTRSNWGTLLLQKGMPAQAREQIESALRIYTSDDRLGPAMIDGALANLASVDRMEGRFDLALERNRRALESAKSQPRIVDEVYLAKFRNNYGNALFDCGRWTEARVEFESVASVRERILGPRNVETITAWNNLGETLVRLGDYERARRLFERAVTTAERAKLDQHPYFSKVLGNLATLCIRQGRPGDAEPLLLRSLAVTEQNFRREHLDRIQPLYMLASLALDRGESALAEERLEEALEMLSRASPEHPQVGVVRALLARCKLKSEDLESALATCGQAIANFERAYGDDGHVDLANALQLQAKILVRKGKLQEANVAATRALGLYRRWLGEEHPSTSVSYAQLAGLARARGNLPDTIDLLQRSLGSRPAWLDRQLPALSEADRIAWAHSHRGVLDDLLSLTANRAETISPEILYRHVASWKGLVAEGLTAGRAMLRGFADATVGQGVQGTFTELECILTAIARFDAESGMRNAAQRRSGLAQLCARKAELERALASASATTADVAPSAHPTSIHSGEALIDYFVYESPSGSMLVAFVLDSRGSPRRVELGPIAPIRDLVEAHRRLLARTLAAGPDGTAEALAARVGSRLRSLVLDPALAFVATSGSVWIVPDGPLVVLPFAALPGRREGSFWIEEREFGMLASARQSARVEGRAAPSPKRKAVLVGAVDYGTVVGGANAWKALPETGREIAEVAGLWRRAIPGSDLVILTGAEATERNVKQTLPGAEYVHLATHGFCRPGPATASRPDEDLQVLGLRSGIALAGSNQASVGTEDGQLTAEELSWCDLHQCNLLVISACDTGLGMIQNGESLAGLRRSLRLAGVKSTLTSLWAVDDVPTRELMCGVCERIWAQNLEPARALRDAQLDTIKNNRLRNSGQALPGTWGAFVLEQAGR